MYRTFKPSGGLEPPTPSLPSKLGRLPWVARGCDTAVCAVFEAAAFATGCDRLRPLGSISAPCFVVWSDDG
jgi:hypothetical protein